MNNERLEPYVGPRPFDPLSRHLFFGRTFETEEVFNLISAHPLLLLYSPSGAGKTSLLNASIIPMLKSEGHEVLPPARVAKAFKGKLQNDIKNIYLFNCLFGWAEPYHVNTEELTQMSLREFLERFFSSTIAEGEQLLILIFDQFEELFTLYPERWQDRPKFFEEIYSALRDIPLLRIVFVMREEFIAQIDRFATLLPERLRIRFRVEQLRREAALEAAVGPLQQVKRTFADGVAEKLVDDLMKISVVSGNETIEVPGEFLEPVQLQLMCLNIWRSLPSDVQVIDERFLQTHGNTDIALANYYEECIEKTVVDSGIKEGLLRNWFENVLITPARTRATVYLSGSDSTGLPMSAIFRLQDAYLIRTEFARGAQWCELTHDRFIEPILNSNSRWRSGLGVFGREVERLEAQAKKWVSNRREEGGLLNQTELYEAKRWLEQADAKGLVVSETLLSLVSTSEARIEERRRVALEWQSRRLDRMRRVLFMLVIAFLVFLAVFTFTILTQLAH